MFPPLGVNGVWSSASPLFFRGSVPITQGFGPVGTWVRPPAS